MAANPISLRGKNMQRYTFVIISALLIPPVLATSVAAQMSIPPQTKTTYNPYVVSTRASQITPFNLAYLAYRGYLHNAGIPSGDILISAHQSGRVTAKDIVQSAVKTNQLPQQTLSDQGYLNALEEQLSELTADRD